MTVEEAISKIKAILEEATKTEDAVCYVTSVDAEPLNLAIEALEKQIPKKPTLHKGWLYCSVCGKDVLMEGYKFCPDCGQRIDWSDEG